MRGEDVLRAFCARERLAPEYDDYRGRPHQVPAATLRGLLAELGATQIDEDTLARQREADWGEPLPPVIAVTLGDADFTATLHAPARLAHATWTMRDEAGGMRSGAIDAATCEVIARAEVEGREMRALLLRLPAPDQPGYFDLRLQAAELPDAATATRVIVSPASCWRPPALEGAGRAWGPALQLYALRSGRNWGMGDFTDLAHVAEFFGDRGAGIIGVNPLHALFPHDPRHASPYSPSSRQHLNVLYLDVEAVDDFRDCEDARRAVLAPSFQARLAALRDAELVDAPGVAAAKFEILAILWRHFRERHLRTSSDRGRAFRAWMEARGPALALHATGEAIREHLGILATGTASAAHPYAIADRRPDNGAASPWPQPWNDPSSSEVQAFRASHAQRIEYYAWLQWLADQQLEGVARRLRERGFAIGLYLDLAISVDRAGTDAWANPALYALGAAVGAPPDEVNRGGQDWGLPPMKPRALARQRLALFRDTVAACMRHAGALRIDHVMGLLRLYWIPPGGSARDGAYVHYPLREQLAILALESHRHRCLVIGEDLGTVPDALREALVPAGVLSYRLMMFEREEQGFVSPQAYPSNALVAFTSHDLATVRGWWTGHDIELRRSLGVYPQPSVYEEHRSQRAQERIALLAALQRAGLWPGDTSAATSTPTHAIDTADPMGTASAIGTANATGTVQATVTAPAPGISHADTTALPDWSPELALAVHAFAASTSSRLMMMQMEDVLGIVDQPNLPGTVDEHPNWRRKLPLPLEQWESDTALRTTCERLAQVRPHAGLQGTGTPLQARIPRATYRLQFHRDFTLDDGAALVPYLARLGVSHVYCSPLTRARPGSRHGYDVVAFDEINPELGGRAAFDRLVAAAHAHGLGLLLDLVPNHMGIGPDNEWWMDVLENGPASTWARYFDIDWHPADASLDGKVLLPVLGEAFGRVLDQGQLRLALDMQRGTFALHYFDHFFPLDPRTTAPLLEAAAGQCDGAAALALDGLAAAASRLPPRDGADEAAVLARARDKQTLRQRLVALVEELPEARAALERAVAGANTADQVDALHAAQAWRLAYWRVASDEINYRRFFDVNDLAALRMEEPAVFEATHGFALDLAAAGFVDGLRIDHPDGLYDPAAYFDRLQRGYAQRKGLAVGTAARADATAPGDSPLATRAVQAGSTDPSRPARPLYVVAEKIAAAHEDVPEDWALHGTTGYRFANLVNGVLVDTAARDAFERIWRHASDEETRFEEIAYQGRRLVMRSTLAAGLTGLTTELLRVARAHRLTRDFTWSVLREALAEVAACMPVYRTYLVREPSAQDVRFVDWAIAQARRRARMADASVFDFVRETLLGRAVEGADEVLAERVRRFAMRYQQFTAPVVAKGVEDTAFYRHHRLVSLNEVGGDPGTFGLTRRSFHGANLDRAARWPASLVATSTHDNKRAEDVRCRLDVLSEMPGAWRLLLRRLLASPQLQRARASRGPGGDAQEGAPIPSGADVLLLIQTLVGTLPAGGLDEATLPAYRERIEAYAIKAAREAKLHTSWLQHDAEYEDGLLAFLRGVLARVKPNPALSELQTFADRLAWFGAFNSATMAALKLTVPGVPDLYQGNELIDLSLVDPDNRRPVDYDLRSRLLDDMERRASTPDPAAIAALAATATDGRLKFWVTWRLLQWRSAQPALFRDGAYIPLTVHGPRETHVIAYARELASQRVIVVAARFLAQLLGRREGLPSAEDWAGTEVELPGTTVDLELEDLLTGRVLHLRNGRLSAQDVFATLPLAVLVPVGTE